MWYQNILPASLPKYISISEMPIWLNMAFEIRNKCQMALQRNQIYPTLNLNQCLCSTWLIR